MKKEAGYSLIEIIIVLGIIGILAVVTIPAFNNYRISNKMKTSSRNLAADLRTARAWAITHDREVKLTYLPGSSQYDYYQGNLTYNSTSWTALTGTGSNPFKATRQLDAIAFFPPGSTLQTFDPDPDTTKLPNNLAVVYRPDGSVKTPAAAPNTNPPGWIITIKTKVSTAKPQYQEFVSASGRVTVQ